MGDQISIEAAPLVLSPTQAPTAAAIDPPTKSYGPGSASETAGSGDGDVNGTGNPSIGGTGDRGGQDELAARG